MFWRSIRMGALYVPGGLLIGYFLIQAENQTPWLIALAIYFAIFAVFGNRYVFFGGKDVVDSEGRIEYGWYERLVHRFFIFAGAIMFILLSAQLLIKGFVLGLEVGAFHFPNGPPPYESPSPLRRLSWITSGIFLLFAGIALLFRSKRAVPFIGIGTIAFILGAAHDYYLMIPVDNAPKVARDLFVMGPAMLIWFAAIVGLRFRGGLR